MYAGTIPATPAPPGVGTMRCHFLLLLATASCVSVFGQDTIDDRMDFANTLIQQGRYTEAIAALTKIEPFDADTDLERGKMCTGLAILRSTIGARNVRYLDGELAYAKVLKQAGMHSEAEKVHADASQSLDRLHRPECLNCAVSVWNLQNQ